MHITILIQHLLNYILLLTHSLSHLILHVQTFFFTAHVSLLTHALEHFFTLGLKQLLYSTLAPFSRYNLIPVYRYGVCKKIIKGLF